MKITFKKLILFMVVIAITILCIAFSASADTEYTDGYYTYTVYYGKATITEVDVTISGNVVVPDSLGGYSVTRIGEFAFYACDNIINVTIPDNITSIGEYAFSNLISVTIPDSVTSIGNRAFSGCEEITVAQKNEYFSSDNGILFNKDKTSLISYPNRRSDTTYIIPDSVTYIGDSAFSGCTSLTSITIPDTVTSIGSSAFSDCYNLMSITLPNSVTRIGGSTFSGCTSLTSITIPDTVTSIGMYAFWRCGSLTRIAIPDGVTSIGHSAFLDCSSLTAIIIPDSVTSIDSYTFDGCVKLSSVIIGGGVISIGYGAFNDCASLTSIVIPNRVISIGNSAFSWCTSLTSVMIGNSVTNIGDSAFSWCKNLTSVIIPDSVTSIGNFAFEYCNQLKSVAISDSVTSLSSCIFRGCENLTSVIIPDSVTSIGSDAFGGCKNLTSITIPDSVTSIGVQAFEQCVGLTNVTIFDSVTTIGERAFSWCDSLTDVYYSGSKEQWKKINVGSGNEQLTGATIHYNSYNSGNSSGNTDGGKIGYKISGRTFTKNIDYFTEHTKSSVYNTELANMAAALSKDIYNDDKILEDYRNLGFENPALGDYYGAFDPLKSGFAMSFKKSEYSQNTICLITVRGSINLSDWVGNILMLTLSDGKHQGFSQPANRIYDVIKYEKGIRGFSGKIKYVITGHSRGAAVANLLAVKLMENGVDSADIYNYNFACPDVACEYVFAKHNNIFNICNRIDPVPQLPGHLASALTTPGTSWGKYGQTYWFTKYKDNRDGLVPDHDMGLYLNFMDQKLYPSEWEKTSDDKLFDKLNSFVGWITKIYCPVDVIVSDVQGNKIASVINGEVDYYNSAFGDVIILTDGDKKIIYVNGDGEFNIGLVGTDNGTMMYSLEKYNFITDEVFESKTFKNVELKEGKEMHSSVGRVQKAENVKLYVTEKQNGKEINSYEIGTDGSEKEINHIYKPVVYNPTYKNQGYIIYTCSCGDSYTVADKKMLTLKKPTSLKVKTVKLASKGKSKVTLTWSKVKGAEKYEVYQYVSKKWKKIKTTSSNSLKVKKLTAGKSYKFRVRAIAGTNKGAYATYTAKVVPLKPSITLKAGKKQFTVMWKTAADITGYEVVYSTSKKFTKKTTKKVTVKKAKTKKTTIKKLKKGKKYYVKVRAYKTVSGKKIYGAWSAVKSVKVK